MSFVSTVIRMLLRLIALALLLVSLVAAGFAVVVATAGDGRAQQTLGQVWFQHDPFVSYVGTPSLPLVGAIVERKIHPFLWNPIFTKVLSWPSLSALLVVTGSLLILACILFLISGKRRAHVPQQTSKTGDSAPANSNSDAT